MNDQDIGQMARAHMPEMLKVLHEMVDDQSLSEVDRNRAKEMLREYRSVDAVNDNDISECLNTSS